ncbi:MAG: DUF3108 domain-containing protein [Methylocystis sp.]|jgi:hypothetical protein|nr:DUF3108 domain-containing protein [Methylocystis sp.]MCA3582962.1 DUF3108 domain-containing protein [Methylocystis sp.]MCA3587285.1 DUF3108 domain-containing protein [Methylocystis sp.]MCA3590367.1 DUF3108 domain-containing protein [Methylocystis sp.]
MTSKKTRAKRRILALTLLASLCSAGGVSAGPVEARYLVTIAGLHIGTALFSGTISPQAYQTGLTAQLTGLAGALTSGRGAVSVSGLLQGNRSLSNGYALSANNSQIRRTIQIAMNAGNISQVLIDPPFEPRDDRVPVLEHHRRNVADPVSALLMPVAGSGDMLASENCNRTIPVFDGVQRFDITLTHAETVTVNEPRKGYVGHALVCRARYAPVAGHRPLPATEYMANNRDMSVWLVPVEGSRTLIPYRIQVKTQIGNLIIDAQSIRGLSVDATASIKR